MAAYFLWRIADDAIAKTDMTKNKSHEGQSAQLIFFISCVVWAICSFFIRSDT